MKHILTTAIAVTVLTLTTSACSTKEDSMTKEQRIEEVAAAARADIDALAAQVGTDPKLRQDEIVDCIPGDPNSGKSLMYTVHVAVDDQKTALDRVRGEISDHFTAKGWTVQPNPSGGNPSPGEGMWFQKGATTMGASIFMNDWYVEVYGSGGCVGDGLPVAPGGWWGPERMGID